MTTRHNDDLFRRLSTTLQDDEKHNRGDEVMRITRGRTYVFKQACWAAELLEELAEGPEPTRLPKEVLNTCEALCFTNAQKGGFGLTGGYGYGFIIKRLGIEEKDGCSKWSPPFFFTISQAGMGLAMGYQHSQTVMALVSQSALDLFMSGGICAGTDLGFYSTDGALTGMAAGILGWRQQRSQNGNGFSYSQVKGAFTEYGVHGSRVVADWGTNSKLYEYPNGADVLAGNVTRHFPEVDGLVQVINRLGKEAEISTASTTEVPGTTPSQTGNALHASSHQIPA